MNNAVPSFSGVQPLNETLDALIQQACFEGAQWCYTIGMLKEKLSSHGQGFLAIGQINPLVGDLAGNAKKILRYIQTAEAIGLDMIVFPELALMGYPIRDVILRHPFLVRENVKWLCALAKYTGKTYAAVGFVEPNQDNSYGKPFYNSLAIIGEGRVQGIVRKSLLPNYNEFNDVRTFEASSQVGMFHVNAFSESGISLKKSDGELMALYEHSYAFSICEDTWNDEQFFDRPLYHSDPMAALSHLEPDAFINVSASPTRSRKEQMKHQMLSHVAYRHHVPYLYVNQVGGIDECSFDGASRLYSAQGELVARARAFSEQFMIINPFYDLKNQPIYPLPCGLDMQDAKATGSRPLHIPKTFQVTHDQDLERTYETICQGIRDYFAKTGFQRAVLGLSGGLDSSVTAVLLADALGSPNVLGVSMPSLITPEENREDASRLVSNLGIRWIEIPIAGIAEETLHRVTSQAQSIQSFWGNPESHSNARDNVQAMSRATLLRLLGNEYGALPIATSDKSEFYLGYATVNGDMSGALAPLGDVPKTKVRALAHWLNQNRQEKGCIPQAVIQKPSGADLCVNPETGQLVTAEEALMPYEFADEIIWRIEALHQCKGEMMQARFQWEERHALPLAQMQAQKQIWLDKFYARMARAVFKWWIAPPIIIVEGNGSIAKTDYHHPITANRIDWDGKTPAEMAAYLGETTVQRAVAEQEVM